MKLRWTRRAHEDLRGIGRYISKDDRVAARRWLERLRQRAREAAELPSSGRVVPEHRRTDLREVLAGNYRIVYLVGVDTIRVLTVFEAHRTFPELSLPHETKPDG